MLTLIAVAIICGTVVLLASLVFVRSVLNEPIPDAVDWEGQAHKLEKKAAKVMLSGPDGRYQASYYLEQANAIRERGRALQRERLLRREEPS